MRAIRWLLAVALGAVVACGAGDRANPDSAAAVADRFVDLYLVEIDQQQALALTTGSARKRIEQELEDVAGIRRQGYSADAAKPRVFYERTMLEENAQDASARAIYDIRIEHDDVETRRHVLVSLSRRDGDWLVSGFFLRDGPAGASP